MKSLVFLALCLAVAIGQDLNNENFLLDHLLQYNAQNGGDFFDHCYVYLPDPTFPPYLMMWKHNGPDTTFGISAYTTGWLALGYSRDGQMITGRVPGNDATMTWVDDTTGQGVAIDYTLVNKPFTAQICPNVCPDTSNTVVSTDDVTFISGFQNMTTGVTTSIFSRPRDTGDTNNDLVIGKGGLEWFLGAYEFADGPNLKQHAYRNPFQLDIMVPTTCPKNCSSQGTCMFGCCYCDPGWGANDCSVVIQTTPPDNGGDLTPDFSDKDYPFNLQLAGDYTIYWKISDDKTTIDFAAQVKTKGWVAFGLSGSGGMLKSDVTLGWIDNSGNPVANDYYITDRSSSCPGVCQDVASSIGGTNDIIAFNGNYDSGSGITTLKWRKKLDTGDTKGDIPFVPGTLDVSWGYNPDTPGPAIAQHGPQTKGNAKIDFFTGTGKVVNTRKLQLAHGYMMFIGWAIFIPVGSFIARFLKKFPWWFNVHRILNGFAMLMTTAAFIIGVYMVPTSNQFKDPHHQLGLAITILGTFQPVLGILADKMFNPDRTSTPIFPDIIHWTFGWSAYLLGYANIILGMRLYGSTPGLVTAFGVCSGVVILFIASFTIFRLIKPSGGH